MSCPSCVTLIRSTPVASMCSNNLQPQISKIGLRLSSLILSKYFPDHDPYCINIAGSNTVIVRDTAHLASVWKNTTALSFEPFILRVLGAFGYSRHSAEKLFSHDLENVIRGHNRSKSLLLNSNPHNHCYIHLQREWLKQQLLPGERLTNLQRSFASHLQEILSFNRFSDDFVVSLQPISGAASAIVSLGGFTRYILSHCVFKSLFGDELFEIEPGFARQYQKWEDDSWKVFFNYPHYMARDLHVAKLRVVDSLVQYYKLPNLKRQKMAWVFGLVDQELEHLELGGDDRAGIVMLILWA